MAAENIKDKVSVGIRADGLKELAKDLKAAGPEFPKRLQKINKALVEDVAREARSAAPSWWAHEAVASIKSSASATEARIVGGGANAPMFFGDEFGGGARPRTRQFRPHRGRDGYVLYPLLRRRTETAEKDWLSIADALLLEGS